MPETLSATWHWLEMMNLIVLHGPPASGKLTIAKELESEIGSPVFHNHLTMDVVKPFFDFHSKEFWGLVEELRLACLKAFAQHYNGSIVYTWVYDHPRDLRFFEEVERIMCAVRATICPVYLRCAVQQLETRVSSATRQQLGKVSTIEGLHRSLDRWNCVAIPRDSCI